MSVVIEAIYSGMLVKIFYLVFVPFFRVACVYKLLLLLFWLLFSGAIHSRCGFSNGNCD